MRTLYVRIFITTIAIMIASSVIAFVVSNVYYHYYLKPQNDEKITEIAKNAVSIYESNDYESTDAYFNSLINLGYQFYIIDKNGNHKMYGNPFRVTDLPQDDIDRVLQGEMYHGIEKRPWRMFITGFFDNELRNTIGIPVQINGETSALFVRPDSIFQFGEMRIFLAILLILVLLFSFLFIVFSTSFIVKPIQKLTGATKKIAAGNYHLKLNMNRRDEIGRLAQNFTKMSDSLAQTEEKRQEFVSNVSHEIQSPLTSIQGFSQAIREEDMPSDMREHYLSIIESESKRLSGLSRQLLMLSTLDREENEMDLSEVNVARQLKETISITEWQWREKDLAVEIDVDEGTMRGDANLLQQVWMNLITNAIRYSNTNSTITVQLREERSRLIVQVSDTGIGIAEDQLPQLFERFYKADKARTRTEESTGLGLSIVKKIVELHQGTIMVESELGQGSTFKVNLPKSSGKDNIET